MLDHARRTRAPLALVVAIGLALTVVGSPSAAADRPHPALSSVYVALGDSYSSGVGAPPYMDTDCRRSKQSYPVLFEQASGFYSFDFVACSGATTQDVLAKQVPAVLPGTQVVTITVGGDNLGFTAKLETCIFDSEESCRKAVDEATAYAKEKLPALLKQVYGQVIAQAGRIRLLVLGYPQLFSTVPEFCAESLMGRERREWINGVAQVLNKVIQDATVGLATFVPVDDLFEGHRVCDSDPWIHGLGGLTEAFHPTATGYRRGYLRALVPAVEEAGPMRQAG
nr:SGNH/GDSL hydrolase family protein [Micromonospora sp. DSM 115978]